MKRALLCLLAFFTLPAVGQEVNHVTLTRTADGHLNNAQLEVLKSALAEADIVLLGEPAHVPLYYPIKIELVRYLHDELGFDVLAFESGLYQMESVNTDFKAGLNTAEAFQQGLFPIWTNTDEFQQLYPYLDSLRAHASPLEITGFDCQVSAFSASKRYVPELGQLLQAHKITYNPQTLQLLQTQLANLEAVKGLSPDFNAQSLDALSTLAAAMKPVPSLSLCHQSLVGWIGHFSDLYYNKILEKLTDGTYQGRDNNVRDSLMAAHMMYLHTQRYPGRKIIGWGANLHFTDRVRDLDTWTADSHGFIGMGNHLKRALGKKVFILAVTTDSNYPGTIERMLGNKGTDLAWIQPDAQGTFSSALLGKPASGNWHHIVDGILYANTAPPAKAGGYFLEGRIVNAADKSPVSFASIGIEGTARGTASDMEGKYFLKVDSTDLSKTVKISCIGFKSRVVAVTSLAGGKTLYLTPERKLLDAVLISGKAPDAQEILRLAIERIPQNYQQQPFNMEFYSVLTKRDTLAQQTYKVESVFGSYYGGYTATAAKNYRIEQKWESGDYYMKEKMHGLSEWPVWEVAYNDIFSTQTDYQIVGLESFKKIDPRLVGTQMYDGDTVFVISYNYVVAGTIYISSKDYAIVRHVTTSEGRGHRNRTEIIYRKLDGKYYPYVANGDYLHEYKIDGKKRQLRITNRVTLRSVRVADAVPFAYNQDLWHPKNVAYDEGYWKRNFQK